MGFEISRIRYYLEKGAKSTFDKARRIIYTVSAPPPF
jgi:hypothetical protein